MRKQLLKHCCAVFLAGFIALLLLPQAAQAQSKEAYVVKSIDKKTLTFYYDDQKSSRTGTVWGFKETKEEYGNTYPAWSGTWGTPESEVTTAVFDASFKNYRPKSTEQWFLRFENLEKIEGLEYLNTSAVTTMADMFRSCKKLTQLYLTNFKTEKVQDMSEMFYGCQSLIFLDLSNFKTEKVQNMRAMFEGCKSLTSLDLSNFKTEKVQDMGGMFYGCSSLTSLDLSNFKTENVQYMGFMFYGCQSLTSLDLSNFKTEKVQDMRAMFRGCNSLQNIYCNDTWTCSRSWEMFLGCTSLQGAVAYDSSKTDASMANPETGYFTKKGITGVATATNEGDASI